MALLHVPGLDGAEGGLTLRVLLRDHRPQQESGDDWVGAVVCHVTSSGQRKIALKIPTAAATRSANKATFMTKSKM